MTPFSGTASMTPAFEAERRIETGPLRLADVLAATFLEWTGPQSMLEKGFATALPFGLTGQFWLSPSSLEVVPSFHGERRADRDRGQGARRG